MSCSISSHVLNTVSGRPADNMKLQLEEQNGAEWKILHTQSTNDDGRVTGSDFPKINPGVYRMTFHTKEYFEKEGVKSYFYPIARIEFIVEKGHYHVPLLISPFSYSTYRGS